MTGGIVLSYVWIVHIVCFLFSIETFPAVEAAIV